MAIDNIKKNAFLGRAALLITTLIWGTSFVILKQTLNTLPVLYVLAFRFSGAAFLLLLLGIKDIKKLDKNYIFGGAALGTMLFLGYTFQTYGLDNTSPGKNAFLTASYCIIVPFLIWLKSKKRPDKYTFIAALVCLVGVGLVTLENDFSVNIGDILTLACGLFFAVHIVMTGRVIKGKSVILLTMVQFATAGLLAWISALLTDPMPTQISAVNIWRMVYLCVMCTAVCFVLQTFGQKHTPPSTVAVIMSLESVFGAAFSVAIYNEELTIKLALGFVLIFVSVIICETKLSFLRRKKEVIEEPIAEDIEPRLFE